MNATSTGESDVHLAHRVSHMPYVSTGEAARALGVDIRSLQRWVQRGEIEPDYVTPGGHYRWDVERIRAELYRRLREQRKQ